MLSEVRTFGYSGREIAATLASRLFRRCSLRQEERIRRAAEKEARFGDRGGGKVAAALVPPAIHPRFSGKLSLKANMRILVGFLLAAVYSFSQATITPFTLTDVSQRFDATGKLVSESRFLFAANRNGSIVAVDLDPTAGRTRQIIDVSTHRIIFIDPNSRSASEVPYYWPRIGSTNACEERFHSIRGAVVSVDRSAGSISVCLYSVC